jgi:hypothetical protein
MFVDPRAPFRRLAVGTALLALAACRGAAPSVDGVVRADSAGVRVITSTRADTVLPWRFRAIGDLTHADGRPWVFEILTPRRVQTDRAGRTYVLAGDSAIVRFGRDGRQDRVLGGRGTAAGAFVRPVSIGSQGDSVVVLDVGKEALVRFGPTLEPLADRPLTGALAGADWIAFRMGGAWLRRGRALVADTVTGAPLVTLTTDAVVLHAVGPRLLVHVGPAYELRLYEGPRLLAVIRRTGPDATGTIEGVALQSDARMYVRRQRPGSGVSVVDVFGTDGAYIGTLGEADLPVALLPNGEFIRPRPAADGRGVVVTRWQVSR